MYYCYALNEFSLADVPDIWRNELEQNSGWLRFSFHAYANDPPFPYDNAAADNVLADYRAVMVQMHRIAGKAATDATTTLHYVCATKETCTALRKEGVRLLLIATAVVWVVLSRRSPLILPSYLLPHAIALILWHLAVNRCTAEIGRAHV